MRLLSDNGEKENLLLNELREAPPEQVSPVLYYR